MTYFISITATIYILVTVVCFLVGLSSAHIHKDDANRMSSRDYDEMRRGIRMVRMSLVWPLLIWGFWRDATSLIEADDEYRRAVALEEARREVAKERAAEQNEFDRLLQESHSLNRD